MAREDVPSPAQPAHQRDPPAQLRRAADDLGHGAAHVPLRGVQGHRREVLERRLREAVRDAGARQHGHLRHLHDSRLSRRHTGTIYFHN